MSNVHCITIIRELKGEGQSVARTLFLVRLALSPVIFYVNAIKS